MSRKLVLLVDDELPIVRICVRLLTREGLLVATANSVAEALEQVQGQPFDLLISDIRLPDGSGMDVIREFMRRQPGKPVVVMTGSPDDRCDDFVEMMGVNDFITKPFEIQAFVKRVRGVLGAGAGTRGECA